MGLITGAISHIGALVAGMVAGVALDQQFKIPKVWHPNELTEKINQELEKFKKDN